MKNVLLIDDDTVSNFVNKKNLQLTGLVDKIETATNGREALSMFDGYYKSGNPLPDFIFLDINMPIMDGFEFLELYNKLQFPSKENIQIIMMSSSENDRDVVKAKNNGVLRYIFKPLTQKDFIGLMGGLSTDQG